MPRGSRTHSHQINGGGTLKKRWEKSIFSITNVTQVLYKILQRFISAYHVSTPQLIKIIDVYLLYIVLTGILQGFYVLCARNIFPRNAMLAGWISTIGSFVSQVRN
jgi:hypothetical protein